MKRKTFRLACALSVLLGTFAGVANAAEYRVWWYDPAELHQAGDVSVDSGPALVKPAWSCGLRVRMPSYYRWVKQVPFTQTPSADLYQDVHVWMPGAGCPYNTTTVKLRDGSQTLSFPGNRDFLGITGYYGTSWIDKDGKVPACNCMPNFPIKANTISWHVAPHAFADLKAMLVDPANQGRSLSGLDDLQAQVGALSSEFSGRVAERRRTDLGDREASVRSLEDQATTQLATASRTLALCRSYAGRAQYTTAHLHCDAAQGAFASASDLADRVQEAIAPQAGE